MSQISFNVEDWNSYTAKVESSAISYENYNPKIPLTFTKPQPSTEEPNIQSQPSFETLIQQINNIYPTTEQEVTESAQTSEQTPNDGEEDIEISLTNCE